MSIFGWINVAFAVAAAVAGVIVLRAVFHRSLSSASTVRFLKLSLVASLAGLVPVARNLTPVQQICMVSVYCSAAANALLVSVEFAGNLHVPELLVGVSAAPL